jgi:hypothetical protein
MQQFIRTSPHWPFVDSIWTRGKKWKRGKKKGIGKRKEEEVKKKI